MSTEVKKSNLNPSQAREILWRKGDLSWLLDDNQKVLANTYKDIKQKIIVWNCARGLGKSWALGVTAIELCLRIKNCVVKYACPTQKQAEQITQDVFRKILDMDCPEDVKPVWNKTDKAFKFKNGSQIQLAGVDGNNAESLRGGSAHLAIVDEAGDKRLTDLEYVITSILFPAVTRTKEINGKIILSSTPPVLYTHPYTDYYKRAEYKKAAITRTIYDNPRFSKEMLDDAIESCKGVDSTTFRREYLCHFIQSTEENVVPEFGKVADEILVDDYPLPAYFDWYVAMDVGMKDWTVVIFAFYDFKNRKLVIYDEFVTDGRLFNTKWLADNIKEKEIKLFTNPHTNEIPKCYKRVMDNNLILKQDLYDLHQISFLTTDKKDAEGAINNVRIMIAAKEIVILKRCETVIRHVREATWEKAGSKFKHLSSDKSHADGLDTLKYLVRNLDKNRNPYPWHFGLLQGNDVVRLNSPGKISENAKTLAKLFTFGKKK